MSENLVQLALQAARHFMMRNRPPNCLKKFFRRYRLSQKIIRTRLDGAHGGSNIRITSEEYDGERRTEFAQALLQLRTAQSRYPHVKKDAARYTFARQALQQMLGRSIGRDLVTSVFQMTFDRFAKGLIVVNNMYAPDNYLSRENKWQTTLT